MKTSNIDNTFVGLLRDNKAPVSIVMGEYRHTIPMPDKQFMFELSVAYKALMMRKDRKDHKGATLKKGL